MLTVSPRQLKTGSSDERLCGMDGNYARIGSPAAPVCGAMDAVTHIDIGDPRYSLFTTIFFASFLMDG